MNKSPLLLLIFSMLFTNPGRGSELVELQRKPIGLKGMEIIATNKTRFPVSISMQLDLVNVKPDKESPCLFVIPPNSTLTILTLKRIKWHKPWSYRYSYSCTIGDALNAYHDDSVIYHLPYGRGKAFKVVQGYNGKFSHKNQNSLDFNMQEGDTIVAARSGVVLNVQDIFRISCLKPECRQYGNYVRVLHTDGSIAEYFHLMEDGALVEVGETVDLGQPIGLSGNTGFSSGPHLHFTVYLPTLEKKRKTVKTRFFSKEKGPAFVEEHHLYTSHWE